MICIILSIFNANALLTALIFSCNEEASWLKTAVLTILLFADIFWMALSITKFEKELYKLKHTANLCKVVAMSNDTWRKTFVSSLSKNNSVTLAVAAADEAYGKQVNTFTGLTRKCE